MIVTNSSVLISLAKIGRLNMLKQLNEEIISPQTVYEETVEEGKKKNLIDATLIDALFQQGVIKKIEVKKDNLEKLKKILGRKLTRGDHEVVSLTFQINSDKVLTDDDNLSRIVESVGLKSISTPDLLLQNLKNKLLSLVEFKDLINELVLKNRISQRIAMLYISRGDQIEKTK